MTADRWKEETIIVFRIVVKSIIVSMKIYFQISFSIVVCNELFDSLRFEIYEHVGEAKERK